MIWVLAVAPTVAGLNLPCFPPLFVYNLASEMCAGTDICMGEQNAEQIKLSNRGGS